MVGDVILVTNGTRAYSYTNTANTQTLVGEIAVLVTTMFLLIINGDRGVEPRCVSNPVQHVLRCFHGEKRNHDPSKHQMCFAASYLVFITDCCRLRVRLFSCVVQLAGWYERVRYDGVKIRGLTITYPLQQTDRIYWYPHQEP